VEKLLESFQAKPTSPEEWIQLNEAVARTSRPEYVLDTSDEALFNPKDMQQAIDGQLEARGLQKPQSLPEYLRLAAESIALSVAESVEIFKGALDRSFNRIVLIGGGARNAILCQALAERSGLPVYAYPTEAAVIGNAAYQLKAMDAIESVGAFRAQIAEQFEPRIFS
jgi:rhamnulokinase